MARLEEDDMADAVASEGVSAEQGLISAADRIKVCARFRPPNAREREAIMGDDGICVDFGADGMSARVHVPDNDTATNFTYHTMLPPSSSQNNTYLKVARPLVAAVLCGCNAACIAYGQTGSGKTHTMFGPGFDESKKSSYSKAAKGLVWDCNPAEYGIIPRIFEDIFARIRLNSDRVQCEVECSFVQLYQEKVTDLVTGLKLRVRQNVEGVFETNALLSPIDSTSDLLALVQEGLKHRVTASTMSNVQSSRSHAILTTKIIQRDLDTGEMRVSTLDLVDLAGSERVSKTGASGTRMKEAGSINSSLLVLSRVIEQLSMADRAKSKAKAKAIEKFVPYRESMLSKLLKNTLGGNSVTTLLICASPHCYNIAETINSLRFGAQAKSIQNKPVAHIVLKPEQLRKAIQRATRTLEEQRMKIQKRQREMNLHRRLVQEVLSRVPAGSIELENIFAVLPTLRSLPRVKKWGSTFIPECLMFEIYEFSGAAGLLKSVLVCKEWRDTLYDKDWDLQLWKTVYLRESKGEKYADNIPVASVVVPVSSEVVAVSGEVPIPLVAEAKQAKAAETMTWRARVSKWYTQKESKRLDQVRKTFRDVEPNVGQKDRQGDTIILLR